MAEQITKDLGGITAYAAAVAAGYTGTKSQFETLMASYATVAQNAAASATAANGSAEDAEAYAVGTRDGSDVGSTDPAYHNNSKYYAELAEDFADSIDPDTLAKVDGYYDTLGAGTAEQLTSNIYEEDNIPYNFRTSGGSIDIGDRETDMLVGGTVGWNQLVLDANKDFANGESTDTRTGFYLAIQTVGSPVQSPLIDIISTVKEYNKIFKATGVTSSGIRIKHNGSARDLIMYQNSDLNMVSNHIYLYSANFVGVDVNTADGVSVKNNQLVDLTAMFGATIADYIYSLEQATAGAGVAWFKKLFPKPYYAYNAGELKSVSGLVSHDMTGFNQMNPESYIIGTGSHYNVDAGDTLSSGGGSSRATTSGINPITVSVNTGWAGVTYISEPLVKGSTYKLACSFTASTAGNIRATAYILDGNNTVVERLGNYSNAGTISAMTYTPTEAGLHFAIFIGSTSTQNVTVTNLCCHLVWDGSRNGEYEAYVKHSYALDSDLTLRGIPKLDNGNLYYDGDTYESDGSVTRKYGIVDLGTLTWSVLSDSPYGNFTTTALNQLAKQDPTKPTYICNAYDEAAFNTASSTADKYIWLNNNKTLIVKDTSKASMTAADFKTAMSGVYLVYELATPTTETADPFTNPQIVNDFGTEEYVDYPYSQGTRDVAIPVGHKTQYMANLKAKLEMSPNSPEGAGDYIVRQTNGENEYVTLASNATIQNIIARIEALEGGGE